MRVLCSALPMEGHVRPLFSVAQALVRARHEVRFATSLDMHSRVHEAGLMAALAGPTMETAFRAAENDGRLAGLSLTQRGGATFSQIIAPAKLVDLEQIVSEWRPHLVIHECTDMAAPIAAACIRVPAVTQGWGLVPVPGQTVPDPADVIALWRSRGLDPDPYCGIFGSVHLHPMPTSLEPEARVPRGRLQPMRLDPPLDTGATVPPWLNELAVRGRAVVYVSLGTHPYFSPQSSFT